MSGPQNQRSQIDEATLGVIGQASDGLHFGEVHSLVGAALDGSPQLDPGLLDKSLQRLRKAGRIEFAGKPRRWRAKQAVTP